MNRQPTARILSTGTEITQGLYADTNAMNLTRLLSGFGFRILGHEAVPDDPSAVEEAIRSTFGRCDLLVMTGGIGPTDDDRNREVLARVAGEELVRIHRAEVMLREVFERRGVEMPERNLRQTYIPRGAVPFLNHWGTATAFMLPGQADRPIIVALPGVPSEWRAMMDRYLPTKILPAFPSRSITVLRTLHVGMLPESTVDHMLHALFDSDPTAEFTLLARPGHIRVRILATGDDEAICRQTVDRLAKEAVALLPEGSVFSQDGEETTIEEVVVERFAEAGKTIALAESCTGGGVAQRITAVPNASSVLVEGIVCYSNDSKRRRLGVQAETLETEGAVSEACVLEMAAGALQESNADVAVSISGIAGPTGGTEEKPVGTVWFGLADRNGRREAFKRWFPRGRARVRQMSEAQALNMLYRWLEGLDLRVDGK
ncbi:nicotinamide-nucleotide amidohydrolase family protein [bacterium]|nr:nicotinamide-nucleotide amidohydrolase family protein [bacterium]